MLKKSFLGVFLACSFVSPCLKSEGVIPPQVTIIKFLIIMQRIKTGKKLCKKRYCSKMKTHRKK